MAEYHHYHAWTKHLTAVKYMCFKPMRHPTCSNMAAAGARMPFGIMIAHGFFSLCTVL